MPRTIVLQLGVRRSQNGTIDVQREHREKPADKTKRPDYPVVHASSRAARAPPKTVTTHEYLHKRPNLTAMDVGSTSILVKPQFFKWSNIQKSSAGGVPPLKTAKKHRRPVPYKHIASIIAKAKKTGRCNMNDISANGIWGCVAINLNWTNTSTKRKYLHNLVWKNNRGGVKDTVAKKGAMEGKSQSCNSTTGPTAVTSLDCTPPVYTNKENLVIVGLTGDDLPIYSRTQKSKYSRHESTLNVHGKHQCFELCSGLNPDLEEDVFEPEDEGFVMKSSHAVVNDIVLKGSTNDPTEPYCISQSSHPQLDSAVSEPQTNEIEQLTNTARKKTRSQRKRKLYSENWEVPLKKFKLIQEDATLYCLCQQPYDEKYGMIECDLCEEWYHFKCIGIKHELPIEPHLSTFYCGFNMCNNGNQFLSVGGKQLLLKPVNHTDEGSLKLEFQDFVMHSHSKDKTHPSPDPELPSNIELDEHDDSDSQMDIGIENSNFLSKDIDGERNTSDDSPVALETEESDEQFLSQIQERSSLSHQSHTNEHSVTKIIDNKQTTHTLSGHNKKKHSVAFNNSVSEFDIASDQDMTSSVVESDGESEPISAETMAKVLGASEIRGKFFERSLPKTCSFVISEDDWLYLKSQERCRHYCRGNWMNPFVQGLKESNKFCVFAFKRHQLSAAKKYKRKNNYLFTASVYCTIHSCKMTARLAMTKERFVDVQIKGSVKHKIIGERNARYFRGDERQALRKLFHSGKKVGKEYMDGIMKKDGDELVAGNFDGIGKTRRVLQKISSEGRQQGRASKDMFDSLAKIKKDLENRSVSEATKITGFIQKIGFSPTFLYYFSENGVRLWHGLAQQQPGFLDATGSVVKNKKPSGTKFLYYELCMQNPSAGNTSIPIAAMITEQQNAPQITDFLNCFQHAEKLIYGHSKVCQPKQINIDFSMALVTSVLKAINVETLDDYLDRCWRILNGTARSSDFNKTNVHICLAHVMKNMKTKIKDVQKKNLEYMLYFIGLVIKSRTMAELREILLDGFVIFSCEKMTRTVQKHQKRLTTKINSFDTSCGVGMSALVKSDFQDDEDPSLINSNLYEEEMYLKIGAKSPFKVFCDKIYEDAEVIWTCDKEYNDVPMNSKYCPKVMMLLRKWYFPTIPLWCNFMLDDLCRHLSEQHKNSPVVFDLYNNHDKHALFNPSKTTSVVEQRFNALKNIHLQGRKLARLDDFSNEIYQYFQSNQKAAVIMHMKKIKRKMNTSAKKNKPVTEQWAKNEKKPSQLSNSGKYQKIPRKMFQSPSINVKDESDLDVSVSFSNVNSNNNNNSNIITLKPRNRLSLIKSIPDQPISIPEKSRCLREVKVPFIAMMNIGNTCWLNSALQAFAKSKVIGKITSTVGLDDCASKLLRMLQLLRNGTSKDILPYIQGLFYNHYGEEKSPTSLAKHFPVGTQHDVHEFYTKMLSEMMVMVQGKLKVRQTAKCDNCNESSVHYDELTSIDMDTSTFNFLRLSAAPAKCIDSTIKIQDLLDLQFRKHQYVDYTCSGCLCTNKATVTPQLDMNTAPLTLVLLLKRYQILHGQFVMKTSTTKIIPDRKIELRSGSQWHPVEYNLRAVVCHLGAYGTGHYIAYVVHDDNIIKCNDDEIQITNLENSAIHRQCYMLIYDRVETTATHWTGNTEDDAEKTQMFTPGITSLEEISEPSTCKRPAFVKLAEDTCSTSLFKKQDYKNLAHCLRQCSSLRHAHEYFQSKKGHRVAAKQDLINDIITDNIVTKKLETGTLEATSLQIALKTIVHEICHDTESNVSFADVQACFGLGIRLQKCMHEKYSSAYIYVCDVATLSTAAIQDFVNDQFPNKILCNCSRDIIVTSLPYTLMLNLNAPVKIEGLLSDINVSDLVPNVPPNMGVVYRINSIIIKQVDGTLLSVVKTKGGFRIGGYLQAVNVIVNAEEDLETIMQKGTLTLFYDKYDVGSCSVDVVSPESNFSFSEPLQFCDNHTSTCTPHMIGDTDINEQILYKIQCPTYWFNSAVIDAYMLLLKEYLLEKKYVHILPAGWFNQTLFLQSDLDNPKLVYDAHDKTNWLQMNYIVIPTNVLDCHWILLVIDIKKQLVIVADSDCRNEYKCAIQQLMRYIGLHVHLDGKCVDFSAWDITYYHKLQGFKKQWDNSSCGPYICQMAKAILYRRSFSFTPKKARRTIARELATNDLIL